MAVSKNRLIADILGDVQRDENDNVISNGLEIVNGHIVPELLYPALRGIASNGDDLIAGNYIWGDLYVPTGKKYFLTHFKGRTPIVDPRIGGHLGTTRHLMDNLVHMPNESMTNYNTFYGDGTGSYAPAGTTPNHPDLASYSVDGRDWMRIAVPQSNTDALLPKTVNIERWDNAKGQYIQLPLGGFIEFTGYFDGVNFMVQWDQSVARKRGSTPTFDLNMRILVDIIPAEGQTVSPFSRVSTDGTNTPLNRMQLAPAVIHNPLSVPGREQFRDSHTVLRGTCEDLNTLTLGIHTCIILMDTNEGPEYDWFGIETVVEKTTDDLVNIPSQTVVSSGRKIITTETNKAIKHECGWETTNPGYGQGRKGDDTHVIFQNVNGQYDEGLHNRWDNFIPILAASPSTININDYVASDTIAGSTIKRITSFNQTFAVTVSDTSTQGNQATALSQCNQGETVATLTRAAVTNITTLTDFAVNDVILQTGGSGRRVYKVLAIDSTTNNFNNTTFAYQPPHNGGRKIEYVSESDGVLSATNWSPQSARASSLANSSIFDSRSLGQSRPVLEDGDINFSLSENANYLHFMEMGDGNRNNTFQNDEHLGWSTLDGIFGENRSSSWTLGDNLTSLFCNRARKTVDDNIDIDLGGILTFSFIGTGLELELSALATGLNTSGLEVEIGALQGAEGYSTGKRFSVVSGLPYGTHIFTAQRGDDTDFTDFPLSGDSDRSWFNDKVDFYVDGAHVLDKYHPALTSANTNNLTPSAGTENDNRFNAQLLNNHNRIRGFNIKQPSKPIIPQTLATVADYMVMANYVHSTSNGVELDRSHREISQGVKRVHGFAGDFAYDAAVNDIVTFGGSVGPTHNPNIWINSTHLNGTDPANHLGYSSLGDVVSTGDSNVVNARQMFPWGYPIGEAFLGSNTYVGATASGFQSYGSSVSLDAAYCTGIEMNMVNLSFDRRNNLGRGEADSNTYVVSFDEPARKSRDSKLTSFMSINPGEDSIGTTTGTDLTSTGTQALILDAGDGLNDIGLDPLTGKVQLADGNFVMSNHRHSSVGAASNEGSRSSITLLSLNKPGDLGRKYVTIRPRAENSMLHTGANIITPIHRSNHYQKWNTKLTSEYVGGGDGIDNQNLIIDTNNNTLGSLREKDKTYFPSVDLSVTRSVFGIDGGGSILSIQRDSGAFGGSSDATDHFIYFNMTRGSENRLSSGRQREFVYYTKNILHCRGNDLSSGVIAPPDGFGIGPEERLNTATTDRAITQLGSATSTPAFHVRVQVDGNTNTLPQRVVITNLGGDRNFPAIGMTIGQTRARLLNEADGGTVQPKGSIWTLAVFNGTNQIEFDVSGVPVDGTVLVAGTPRQVGVFDPIFDNQGAGFYFLEDGLYDVNLIRSGVNSQLDIFRYYLNGQVISTWRSGISGVFDLFSFTAGSLRHAIYGTDIGTGQLHRHFRKGDFLQLHWRGLGAVNSSLTTGTGNDATRFDEGIADFAQQRGLDNNNGGSLNFTITKVGD